MEAMQLKVPRPKTMTSAAFSRVGRRIERRVLMGSPMIQISVTMLKEDVTGGNSRQY
jgi:hypothetical protein